VSTDKDKSTPVISLVFSVLDLLSNFGRLYGRWVLYIKAVMASMATVWFIHWPMHGLYKPS